MWNFKTIRPVGAGVFRADEWTNGRRERHDEPYSRFPRFFLKEPNKSNCTHVSGEQAASIVRT